MTHDVKTELPPAVNGVIDLDPDTTYEITEAVDPDTTYEITEAVRGTLVMVGQDIAIQGSTKEGSVTICNEIPCIQTCTLEVQDQPWKSKGKRKMTRVK